MFKNFFSSESKVGKVLFLSKINSLNSNLLKKEVLKFLFIPTLLFVKFLKFVENGKVSPPTKNPRAQYI
jgi:hypothetical protein